MQQSWGNEDKRVGENAGNLGHPDSFEEKHIKILCYVI